MAGGGRASPAEETSCCSKKSTSGSSLCAAFDLGSPRTASGKLGICGHELWWTKGCKPGVALAGWAGGGLGG